MVVLVVCLRLVSLLFSFLISCFIDWVEKVVLIGK